MLKTGRDVISLKEIGTDFEMEIVQTAYERGSFRSSALAEKLADEESLFNTHGIKSLNQGSHPGGRESD
jgi:hypothetical protein